MAPNNGLHHIVSRQQGSAPQGNYRTHSVKLDESRSRFKPKNSAKSVHATVPPLGESSHNINAAALSDRLQELLVLEFHKDGSRRYMHLTVRGLYRHVLDSITDRGTLSLQTTIKVNTAAKTWLSKLNKCNEQDVEAEPDANARSEAEQVLPETEELDSLDAPLHPISKAVMERHSSTDAMPHRYGKSNSNNVPPSKRTHHQPSPHTTATPTSKPTSHHHHHHSQHVTYRERLGAYLHPRDMRRLVTPFSTSNEPELIVRRHVMLLNFDPLRAIILRDRLLVLVPDGADSLLVQLEERVRGGGGSMDIENSIFGPDHQAQAMHSPTDHGCDPAHDVAPPATGGATATLLNVLMRSNSNTKAHAAPRSSLDSRQSSGLDDACAEEDAVLALDDATTDTSPTDATHTLGDEEFEEMKDSQWANLSFELQCADAVLHVVGSILSQDTFELQSEAESRIHLVLHGHGFNDDPLLMIRTVKDAVQVMTSRVNGFIKSMNRILDDDEDMALMNLSRLVTHPERYIQPVPQRVLDEESDEPELILEANLHNSLTLLNYLDLTKGQINTAKELIDQKQDATRNRLLFANMMISILSLSATVAAMIGSFFGMNVPNGYEDGGCLGSVEGTCTPSTTVFKIILGATLLASTVVCLCIVGILWCSGTIPRTHHIRTKGQVKALKL